MGKHERNLPRAVERHARETPRAPALTWSGEAVSYLELNARANQLACRLESLGAAPGALVGLCLPRGPELVIALLAHPEGRRGLPAARSGLPGAAPASHRGPGQAAGAGHRGRAWRAPRRWPYRRCCLDRVTPWRSSARARLTSARASNPVDPCYVIFTSGSTGEPKGVMVTHGNVARLFDDIGPRLGLGPADVWSQIHSCAFGFSVFEIWGALVQRCLSRRRAGRPSARTRLALREFLRRSGVTILSQTPSAFRETVLSTAFAGAWPALAVRALVSERRGGARRRPRALVCASSRRLARGWSTPTPSPRPAATSCSASMLARDLDARNIGRPLRDVDVHVLDPAGCAGDRRASPGELYVGGPGRRGRLPPRCRAHRRALRRARRTRTARAYRTGDIVRGLPDGSLEFLGRADDQVKWRGYRLELGEIESLLRTHPGVSAAAAAIRADEAGNEKLVAYVVPGAGASPPREPEFWPSLGGYQVYDDFLYDLMSADTVRNAAFRAAFARQARDRVVLDLGTGPHALLARLAVEAGARHVYAVGDPAGRGGEGARGSCRRGPCGPHHRHRRRRGAAAAAGTRGGMHPGHRRQHRQRRRHRADLERRAVAVRPALCAGAGALHDHDRGGRAARTRCASPRRSRRWRWTTCGGSSRRRAARSTCGSASATSIPQRILSDCRVFEDLDFRGELPEGWRDEGRFTLKRAGRFDGFLLWTVVTTTDGVTLDYLAHQHAWLPVFMPLPGEGAELPAGAAIDAAWEWAPGSDGIFPDYTIRCEFSAGGNVQLASYTTRHHETACGGTAIHRRLLALRDTPAESLAPGELRAWLARHLPEPLLPNAWMYLEALPLNLNGKLDRRALPAPQGRTWGGHGGAPQTALESDLAALWSEILGVSAVGMQDNFFDLGGDSIAAVRLTTRVQQLLDDGVMLAAIFEAPTIAALARYLGEHHRAAVESRYGAPRPHAGKRSARPGSRRKHGEL